MKKKITSDDLSLNIRSMGSASGTDNLNKAGNTGAMNNCPETQDDCNTIEDCKTNIYCDTVDECKTAYGCEATVKCPPFTEVCAHTQSKAVLCCPETEQKGVCDIQTKACKETEQCLVTNWSDCNTSKYCYQTAYDCPNTKVCPATDLDTNCV